MKSYIRCSQNKTLQQSTAVSMWWCGPPNQVWVGSKWLLPFLRVPVTPGTSFPQAFFFSLCCPLNDRRRAAHSFFKNGRLSSLARLCLLILLLLMSGNVHTNPGPIFPCSVCAKYVTWQVRSVQC